MSRRPRALLPALALLSGSGLLLEVALTRVLSTLYFPPTVFAVISLAVLGLGLGAALVTARPAWREARSAGRYAALGGLSGLLLAAFAVLTAPYSVLWLLLTLVVVPFLFIGMAITVLFADHASASPRLYLADLLGAGLGALLAVPLLNLLGGVNGVLAAGVGLAAAGLLVGSRRFSAVSQERAEALTTSQEALGMNRWLAAVVLLASLALLAANTLSGFLTVDMSALSADKPIVESLQGQGRIVATRWDAFARSDLVAPGDGGPYRLYIDGGAGSIMPPAENNDFLWQDIGLFPFATEQPQRVFVIGPGGGLDVWFGLQSGAEEIVAVEVNGASIDLVRQFAAYNGDLYGQPQVRVVRDEGRSVLRREERQYDLIFMSQLVTQAAERSGYALVEDKALTVEAFHDYLDHLDAQGMLALKLYDEPTLTRALATALAALRERGVSDDAQALTHVMAFVDPGANPPIPLLMVRNSPFSREDSLSLGAVAQQVGFTPLFLPQALAQPPLEAVAAGEMPFSQIVAGAEADISPARDNRPFFYQFEHGLPESLQPLLAGLAVVVFAGAALVLRAQGRQPAGRAFVRIAPLYFAALGLGFIMLEVAVIQQTRLFLGHPTLAVAVTLATLLVGGGLGSELAGRLVSGSSRPPLWAPLAVAGLGLAWLLLWPLLSEAFVGAQQGARLALVVVGLAPLALVMGIPFPLGLRALSGEASFHSDRHVALAWAVNGIMSVVGSALAVSLAMLWGFTTVVAAALVSYVVAGACIQLARIFSN